MNKTLFQSTLETPLGKMVVIASDDAVYLLEFSDGKILSSKISRLQKQVTQNIIEKKSKAIIEIEKELQRYFKGEIKTFKTPFKTIGTVFQNKVWKALQKIPFGETQSYLNIAKAIEKPFSYRAVANSNAANALSIIIPCHRVIHQNGNLSGYAGGNWRKEWLLAHESSLANT